MCCEDPIGEQGGGLNRCCTLPPPISHRGMCVLADTLKDGCCLSLPLLSLFSSPHCLHSFPLLFPLPSILSVILLCTFSPSGGYKGRSCWRERACVISSRTGAPENYCSGWEGKAAEEPQRSRFWSGTGEGGAVDLQRGNRGRR